MNTVRVTVFVAAVVAVCSLSACGGPDNADPRKGRVMLDESNCLFGGCYSLYEFCLGPDLHVVYDEAGDDDYARTEEDSPECAEVSS